MNLIITMAGKYIRFKNAGYTTPKFLLPLKNGHSIFQEIMEQLVAGYTFENIVFIANKQDIKHKAAIDEVIRRSEISEYQLHFIRDTKGQAETALYGIEQIEKKHCRSQKILIHNIDTVLYNRDMMHIESELDRHDGYIDVFEASENRYSYVKTDDNNFVTEIKEKEVISSKATTGLYAFSNIGEYRSYYNKLRTSREYYISFIYELMLRDKKKITVNSTNAKTLLLGTPDEYEKYNNVEQSP
jgi:dTDP-glucose pyrophosphorylase